MIIWWGRVWLFFWVMIWFSSRGVAAVSVIPPVQMPLEQRGRFADERFTGSAVYTYAIDAPQVSLSYDSLGVYDPSSFVGVGWQISMAYVEKVGDTYRLHLHGRVYDLVFVPSEDRYHTELSSPYTIQQIDDLGSYWIVTDADGATYRFGSTAASTVLCEGREYVHQWYLDQRIGSAGDRVTYTYQIEGGVAYPRQISHGDSDGPVVEFTYRDNPHAQTQFPHGCEMSGKYLLEKITVKQESGDRTYSLDYATDSLLPLLTSITTQPTEKIVFPQTSFTYSPAHPSWEKQPHVWLDTRSLGARSDPDGIQLIDVDRDARPDLVTSVEGGWQVRRNTGASWEMNAQVQSNPPRLLGRDWEAAVDAWIRASRFPTDLSREDTQVGDVNDDRLPDVVTSVTNESGIQWFVWFNTGHTWVQAPHPWLDQPVSGVGIHSPGVVLVDVTSDGRSDLVQMLPSENQMVWRFWTNTGSGWSREYEEVRGEVPTGFSGIVQQSFLADVTGDGGVDSVAVVQIGDRIIWYVWKHTTYAPHLLSSVRTASGRVQGFLYQAIAIDDHARLPFPLWVAERGMRKGDRGEWEPYAFTYQSGLYDSETQRWYGFGKVSATDVRNMTSTWRFHQRGPEAGQIKEHLVQNSQGQQMPKKSTAVWDISRTIRWFAHAIINLFV